MPISDKSLRYSTVLFDWGDTVMRDDPAKTAAMVEWETIEVVDGIAEVLTYLHSSGRSVILATSADISDESQIRGALRRGGLDRYFSKIYCFRNTGLSKGKAFYRYILDDLQLPASDVLMVGDHFEKDVHIPNLLGMFAVWFNLRTEESHKDEFCVTVHSIDVLKMFFESLDS